MVNSENKKSFKSYESLDIDKYLHLRLADQIDWYDNKSSIMKNHYLFWKSTTFTSGAFVPFMVAMGINKWVTGLLGVIVVISESVLSVFKYHDLWIEYRKNTEMLQKELVMFQTRTGVYRDSEFPFADLVERSETLISNENINWANLTKNDKAPTEGNKKED
ncbi:DUF4231 domain-containing protein [Weissella paramesenteroides]|uniref:DUF4231 domain-containing protein n=1 Tax=Weissella paramesenteroides ATCC 33313 TaxID=585506 RepID=C5RAA5_WEIPA|nr:DUF4231 domain-containing protein [Weissella paramesenteroides]ATF40912.1 DUF4231 domain-containing protein [Weissella paramesenteroides]EER74959.1 hypothetical protein HMPREF0877_0900 [Weissella paramesenteroides ATCC 33313]